MNITPHHSELGKETIYDTTYNPSRLYPIPRASQRKEIGIAAQALPFYGVDTWNHYEVSWLNEKGKPIAATAEIFYDCHSPFLVESKSLKLYFNSFNQSTYQSVSEIENIVKKDLEKIIESPVSVIIHPLEDVHTVPLVVCFEGQCIDHLDITCSEYEVSPHFLSTHPESIKEILYSNLLKSNCLITHQPDWASIQIHYQGNKIDQAGLLRYIVSYRNHNEFHEQCIERIFMDILTHCHPSQLTVYGRYTRRGGLDINPYRSTEKLTTPIANTRLIRQ